MNNWKLIIFGDGSAAARIRENALDLGYKVPVVVEKSAEALKAADSEGNDSVLIWALPGACGANQLLEAEALQRESSVPVLLAHRDEDDPAHSTSSTEVQCVGWPFQKKEFISAIQMASYRVKTSREIRKLTRLYSGLSQMHQCVIAARTRSELAEGACRVLVEHGGFKHVWLGLKDEVSGTLRVVAQATRDGAQCEAPCESNAESASEDCAAYAALTKGDTSVFTHDQCEQHKGRSSSACKPVPFRSGATFPIRIKREVRGVLVFFSDEDSFFHQQEIKMCYEAAAAVGFGMQKLDEEERRLEAEEQLQRSEEHFRLLYEQSPVAYQSLDESGQFLDVNQAWLDMLGYKREEVVGHWFGDFLANSYADAFRQRFPRFRAEGYIHGVEFDVVHKNGRTMTVAFDGRIGYKEPGVFRQTHCVMRNITEVKRALNSLQESEERYRKLIELSFDAIFIYCEGKVIFANPAGVKLLGAAAEEELLGRSVLDFIHPEDLAYAKQRIQLLLDTGLSQGVTELRLVRPDGTIVEAEVGSTPFQLESKRAVQMIARDMTDRKRVEAEILRSQRIDTIGSLASGIAHDLNNILAPILLSVDLLRAERPTHGSLSLITMIESNARRGAHILRQLLAFGRGLGQRVLVSPTQLINDMANVARETFPKNIQVETNAGGSSWLISGDPTLFQQVMLNLCVNARDAMPTGGVLKLSLTDAPLDECYVRMSPGAKPGPYVCLCVSDTGHGIEPQNLNKIFEPFFTTKPLGQGTGLGLATVYSIVHKHGGFVRVSSELGRGAMFSVYLPAETQAAAGGHAQAAAPEIPSGNGEVILIVDDEPEVLEVGRRTLQMHGYTPITAQNGAEAVARYARHQPKVDCVILDMIMPAMDGLATARALRVVNPAVKIIIASGMASETQESQLSELRIHARLEKPFTAANLLCTLYKAIHA